MHEHVDQNPRRVEVGRAQAHDHHGLANAELFLLDDGACELRNCKQEPQNDEQRSDCSSKIEEVVVDVLREGHGRDGGDLLLLLLLG
jgi:hypothetical protein